MFTERFFLIISLIEVVAGGCTGNCPNSCSGHGTCGLNYVCTCYDNYGMGLSHDTGDCSDRVCPYELAWVDTPDKLGRRHKYAECAGRGICNRDSGECECFAGYEGKACARTTCPNDCSGHGRCKYIEDLPYAATPFDYGSGTFHDQMQTFTYNQWDLEKTRGCVCDPGYADIDCSKRICPYANDVQDHRLDMIAALKYQTQRITLVAESSNSNTPLDGKTFALTFKSKMNETFTTIPIVVATDDLPGMQVAIRSALKNLPNGVIDDVEVTAHAFQYNSVPVADTSANALAFNISFTGNYVQGPQYLLDVEADLCGDGCTPKLTGLNLHPVSQNVTEVVLADYNSFECGRRGKCDYTSGLCECFEGYTGLACNVVTALV